MAGELCVGRSHMMALAVIILAFTHTAKALDCYVCNSTLDNNCNERFEYTNMNPVKPVYCNVYGARYCIKVYGMWGGVVGTHRFCSSRDMGHQCQDIWYADHDRMYRSCIYTCSGNACNAGEALTTSWYRLLPGLLLTMVISLLL